VPLGAYQGDAIRNMTGWFRSVDLGGYEPSTGLFTTIKVLNQTVYLQVVPSDSGHSAHDTEQRFNASNVVPTAFENRPRSTNANCYIIVK
jgi:hypothetical protein